MATEKEVELSPMATEKEVEVSAKATEKEVEVSAMATEKEVGVSAMATEEEAEDETQTSLIVSSEKERSKHLCTRESCFQANMLSG